MLDNNHDSRLYSPATTLAAAGLSIIPVGTDKRPLTAWKPFQERPADTEALGHWFISNGTPAAPALAVICGAVSGGLTVLDFDTDEAGATLYEDFATMVEASAPLLLGKLPHVQTPSGGMHVYLRCTRCEGNQQLAVDEMGLVRIETRGQGGYVVAPPSRGYRALGGTLREIPRIEEREYRLLLRCARALSEAPPAPVQATHTPTHQVQGDRPGDAYSARATLQEVAALLCRHGWTAGRAHADKIPMTRPGKSAREGTSGDVAFINGIATFTQFSSNGGPFKPRKGYTAFAVYALLEHGGDYRAAAGSLGEPRTDLNNAPALPTSGAMCSPEAEASTFNWRDHVQPLKQIWATEYPEPTWFVEGYIPSGTTIMAGSPKTGKSLIGWQIALARASGGRLFGKVEMAMRPVLYICIEDHKRLVKKRTMRMMQGKEAPDGLDVADAWRPLLRGGIEDLRTYLAEHPGTDVVIDTYEKLREPTAGGNAAREDYSGLAPLTAFAHEVEANVLIVHHTSKQERADVMDTISGAKTILAAVDNGVVLTRGRFVHEIVTLSIVGRELDEEKQVALEYHSETLTHTLLGEAEAVVQTRTRAAIVRVLSEAGEALGLHELAEKLGQTVTNTLRSTLSRMVDDGQIARTDRGVYRAAQEPEPPEDDVAGCDVALVAGEGHTHTHTHTTSATSATSVRSQQCDDAPTPFPQACPGCGHHGNGLPAPYDRDLRLCGRCGCELGEMGLQR